MVHFQPSLRFTKMKSFEIKMRGWLCGNKSLHCWTGWRQNRQPRVAIKSGGTPIVR